MNHRFRLFSLGFLFLFLAACLVACNGGHQPLSQASSSGNRNGTPADETTTQGSRDPQNLVAAGYRTLRAPPGFRISLFSANVPDARSLARGDRGTVFVSTMKDRVYALVDQNGDGRADATYIIARGLNMPNGLAFRDGSLYVAEVSRILRYDGIESRLSNPPPPVVIRSDFPTETSHGWKFIAFGPDGKLYVPLGMPCNICDRSDQPFGTILRMNPDGTGQEVYARGIRNTVGFTWHPDSKELWFTDNGRDMLGDDVPPDELNHAPQKGLHFGFPYCHGTSIKDPEFNQGRECSSFTAPVWRFEAHVAPLGLRFYTGNQFPSAYKGRLIVAEHGSWNRTQPIGYRLVSVEVDGGRAVKSEIFIDGWLQNNNVSGRPVDLMVQPDGSLLVSDDEAGVVYRVTYSGASNNAATAR